MELPRTVLSAKTPNRAANSVVEFIAPGLTNREYLLKSTLRVPLGSTVLDMFG